MDMEAEIRKAATACWRAGCDEKDGPERIEGVIRRLLSAALAACAREAARPFKEALMVNPFSDGQDGDLCLWCRTSYPRGLTKFEEHFLPEHHLSTCELVLVLEKWAALEAAGGKEKGGERCSRK